MGNEIYLNFIILSKVDFPFSPVGPTANKMIEKGENASCILREMYVTRI